MNYRIDDIATIIGASAEHLPQPSAEVSELLTDSRSLGKPSETLFFALTPKGGDGHRYVPELYAKGVRNFVVQSGFDASAMPDANVLAVTDTLLALQTLAAHHRRKFDIPVIAITGSRGKTVVKEWLYQLLHREERIVRSPRSYNSQIGVALSLWDIDNATTLAIIEAGISERGEMERLHNMIAPTIGIVTNVTHEHDAGFSSMQEKTREKARLLEGCDLMIACADVPDIVAALPEGGMRLLWSRDNPDADLWIKEVTPRATGTTVTYVDHGFEHTFLVPFTADADIENVITCLAVMLYMGIDTRAIAQRMAQLQPAKIRLNVIEGVNNCTLMIDSYTSDYYSLTPAIDFLRRRTGSHQRMTVVLSDLMPESFDDELLYQMVAHLLTEMRVTRLIGVGEKMCRYRNLFSLIACTTFETTDQMLAALSQSDFADEAILVKGAPEYNFDSIVLLLEAKQHQTVEEIDLNALADNFRFFKSLVKPSTKTVAMVKASGYGTGSYEIAKTLQDRGCDYLAVAVQDEGVDLRRAGITMPIIVLNPCVVNYRTMFAHHLEPEIYSIEECRDLVREGERYCANRFPVHIKIDSGMHRLGFTLEQLPELIDVLKRQTAVQPASVFSHLCAADIPEEDEYTLNQINYFNRCADLLQQGFSHHIMRHVLNTTGIVRFNEHQMDMVRIGVGLYGVKTVTDGREDALQPVASLQATIISIKEWDAGVTIGYGRRGVLKRHSRIATVNIGYADGLDRHFGNGNTRMWVNGTLCPTVGNVCMDAVMIDVTEAQCAVGDRVEIFGRHVDIETLAAERGTIAYEILTSVSPRVKRVYFRN